MEKYSGVKFKTILNNEILTFDSRLEELKYWCKIFHKKNLAPPYEGGSFGNLSFRLSPTGSSIGLKEELANDCFVKVTDCDMEKHLVFASGNRNPSSESMMHYAIYEQRPQINAIFHGHCNKLLQNTNILGIAQTEKEEDYGTIQLVNLVLKLSKKDNFLNIKNHGFISLGDSMNEAGVKSVVYNMLSAKF